MEDEGTVLHREVPDEMHKLIRYQLYLYCCTLPKFSVMIIYWIRRCQIYIFFIRMIARGFYGIKHGLVIDVLVRNACVKEEDIQVGFSC